MRSETTRCLERVEAALDPAQLARTRQLWVDCRHYRPIPHLPLVCMCPAPDWPQYTMDEIQADMEKMLVSELAHVYAACLVKADTLTVFTRAHQAIDGIPFAPAPTPLGRVCRDAGVMVWQWITGLTPEQREEIRTGFTCIQWAGTVVEAKQSYAKEVAHG